MKASSKTQLRTRSFKYIEIPTLQQIHHVMREDEPNTETLIHHFNFECPKKYFKSVAKH